MKITRLSECTFEQAIQVWNKGFEGYFADVTMSLDGFIARLSAVGLSAEGSIVAWENNQPVGFILNGFRTVRGVKIAWNGGTGVDPQFRGTGYGRRMMEACLDVYKEHDVDIAYLEAIAQNTPAIALYERMGYRVVDHLTFFTHTGPLPNDAFRLKGDGESNNGLTKSDEGVGQVVRGLPQQVAQLPFYQAFSSWQTQWQSVSGGQAVILLDSKGDAMAYALYKSMLNDAGEVSAISLLQCATREDIADQASVIRRVCCEVYGPFDLSCTRSTVNTPASGQVLVKVLEEGGFTPRAQQVMMQMDLSDGLRINS
ncbi:GNAT family N-acetyltransferase [Alicyclobacillus sp. ALC3]|uniref:GNAT family N-acetyltransferase n=1 Tax=Alicyclobacillus sp. ALC3 TaxID=2796143 RepID=UPI002379C8D1|nr:GNAT family N-acetyltransferase [Alicyclobacillus sp. ALC3]WDL98391.1 GNAT family N-acetyltransferase [Alicyclobacillus sp. ALC3]